VAAHFTQHDAPEVPADDASRATGNSDIGGDDSRPANADSFSFFLAIADRIRRRRNAEVKAEVRDRCRVSENDAALGSCAASSPPPSPPTSLLADHHIRQKTIYSIVI